MLGIFALLCSPIFVLDPALPHLEAGAALLGSAPARRGCLDGERSRTGALGALQNTLLGAPREDALETSAGQRQRQHFSPALERLTSVSLLVSSLFLSPALSPLGLGPV